MSAATNAIIKLNVPKPNPITIVKRSLVLVSILAIFLFSFGCLEDKSFSGKAEQIANSQSFDIDDDGIVDYAIYDFAPITMQDAGIIVQRQLTVATSTTATYTKLKNTSEGDLLLADQDLDSFTKSKTQADMACGQAIGLNNVVCSDVATCSKLCSVASQKCKKIASAYDEALTGAMISYAQVSDQISGSTLDARRIIISASSQSDKQDFLTDTRNIIAKIADMNANPIYSGGELGLCEHSDYGVESAVAAAQRLGSYNPTVSGYHYRMIISIKPIAPTAGSTAPEINSIAVTDKLPQNVTYATAIASFQQISQSDGADGSVTVGWSSTKTNKAGYLFTYDFKSDQPPEFTNTLKSPDIKTKNINKSVFGPVYGMILAFSSIFGNYYFGFGAAIGFAIAMVFFIIMLLSFAISAVTNRNAGMAVAFRKAFGKTDVKWKGDIITAVIGLGLGYYLSNFIAQPLAATPSIVEIVDTFLKSDMGLVGAALTLVGVAMLYFAIENFVKILVLERAYGVVIKKEKDIIIAKASTVKGKIAELETLLEEYSRDDFDVSKEYEALNSMKAEKLDAMSKEVTTRSKAIIEEDLARMEKTIDMLKERKRTAEENWPRWKDNIAKILDEQGEVYANSLVIVPNSLRLWAIAKYAKEAGKDSVSFERDMLKKKKTSPEQIVQDLVRKGLVKGIVVMKDEKIVASEFSEGSGTVMGALVLKLSAYLKSLAKNLGQHAPQSVVTIGNNTVLVMMKSRAVDAYLFMGKDKFKDAIEQWKVKAKAFE